MNERRGDALAARLRAVLDRDRGQQTARAALSERQRAAALDAQAALFEDLRRFGDALGAFGVARRERALTLRFGRRELRFEAIGDTGVVRVRGSRLFSGAHRLLFAPDGQRWMLSTKDRDGRERLRPLFDAGLEELMDRVFSLRASPAEGPRDEG